MVTEKALSLLHFHYGYPNHPLIVLGSNHESLRSICAELESLNQMLGDGHLKKEEIILFPDLSTLPYSEALPSTETKHERLKKVFQIQKGLKKIYFFTVASFFQFLPPPQWFQENTISFSEGASINRHEFIDILVSLGYSLREKTSESGDFSVRGSIIDIFPVQHDFPFRLDFFDEELESIRTFDPDTQKTLVHWKEKLEVFPASIWHSSPDNVERSKIKIKNFCDSHDIPKKVRDEFFELTCFQASNTRLDYLLPFLQRSGEKTFDFLADHFPVAPIVIGINEFELFSHYSAFFQQRQEDYAKKLKENEIHSEPSTIFLDPDRMKQWVADHSRFFLNSIAIKETLFPPLNYSNEVEITAQLKLEKGIATKIRLLENHARSANRQIVLFTGSASNQERMEFILNHEKIPFSSKDKFSDLFPHLILLLPASIENTIIFQENFLFVAPKDYLEFHHLTKPYRKASSKTQKKNFGFFENFSDLHVNDIVVHSKHGIGRYLGLTHLTVDRQELDCIQIEYANQSKLYVPTYALEHIQKYSGPSGQITLDHLGSAQFQHTKAKIKEEIQDLAHRLLKTQAQRQNREGFAYSVQSELYQEFEAQFPYYETEDQAKAIEDVIKDMSSMRIMDRLICGDVGYGKTEVAMRACCIAALNGKQTAVLAPTTILTLQHEKSFKERFKGLPFIRIESVSRLKSPKEVKKILQDTMEGKVDILIGTHRLLSKDLNFKNLGLLVIDEEQKFGVEHKERVKQRFIHTDLLTLSATPIPRTLHLSLSGLKDISIINTPPLDRHSIETEIISFDPLTLRRAIEHEINRGGQVFFVHNRVQTLARLEEDLQKIVPHLKIISCHGQMKETEIERRILDFYFKKAHILLSTAIIESGLDIPSVNTMFIDRADTFGLSQLYQLRGRVGRSNTKAFCYMILPKTEFNNSTAIERLEVLQRHSSLGSGFKIAAHDLEMRGGGEILGKQQSGHVMLIGYEMYLELLEETIQEIKGQTTKKDFDPEIKIPVPCFVPDHYIMDVQQRLEIYKRLSSCETAQDLKSLTEELIDRFGEMPQEVNNLVYLLQIKQLLIAHKIQSLKFNPPKAVLQLSEDSKSMPFLKKHLHYSILSPDKISLSIDTQQIQRLFYTLEDFFA